MAPKITDEVLFDLEYYLDRSNSNSSNNNNNKIKSCSYSPSSLQAFTRTTSTIPALLDLGPSATSITSSTGTTTATTSPMTPKLVSCSHQLGSACDLLSIFTQLQQRIAQLQIELCSEPDKDDDTAAIDIAGPVMRCTCRRTLETSMTVLVGHAQSMFNRITNYNNCGENDDHDDMVSKLRLTLALRRVEQLLDLIDMALITSSSNPALDAEMTRIVEHIQQQQHHQSNNTNSIISFSVSPWRMSELAFDVPAGPVARRTVLPTHGKDALPLSIEIAPVFEIMASDLIVMANNKSNTSSSVSPVNQLHDVFPCCTVKIENCSHRALHFAAGSGTIGEATIRVRISPMQPLSTTTTASTTSSLRQWGTDEDSPKLCVKEARVVQVNAYPPKPRTNVDLYMSYSYGEPDVALTMVIKTCQTSKDVIDTTTTTASSRQQKIESPFLHIELFMAPPRR